jgi:methylated-DNA-[protein]-cysteine S-methyltransferase
MSIEGNLAMPAVGYSIFDTALGCCGIAWGEHGVLAVQLPEADAAKTQARLQLRVRAAQPASPPAELQQVIDGIRALLSGEPADLSTVRLDMHGVPPLHCRVYAIARTIAPSATLTYGDIADRLGDRSLARAVGQALGRNPFAPVVPCHRVLAAGGRPGGFSAHGGLQTKLRLLMIEGANPSGQPDLFSGTPKTQTEA